MNSSNNVKWFQKGKMCFKMVENVLKMVEIAEIIKWKKMFGNSEKNILSCKHLAGTNFYHFEVSESAKLPFLSDDNWHWLVQLLMICHCSGSNGLPSFFIVMTMVNQMAILQCNNGPDSTWMGDQDLDKPGHKLFCMYYACLSKLN